MAQGKARSFIHKHRIDIIVISSLLFFSIIFLLISDLTKKAGSFAEVTVDGATVGKYSLEIDSTYSINNGTNVITVENGYVYMSYSSCPDHVCENTGKAKHVGQTIVCLPNRVTVTIIGKSDAGVDFVS